MYPDLHHCKGVKFFAVPFSDFHSPDVLYWMFEERDVSLIVSVLITSNPDLRSRFQSCVSVIVFFPNPLGGFTR
jgi:hypothetical protein